MKKAMQLRSILPESDKARPSQLALFALINLGIIDSLANGVLAPPDAVQLFFNADNCIFVQQRLRDRTADKIMSHGVQLADLFDVLPAKEARREFLSELNTMRSLCLRLLGGKRLVA